ATALEERRDFVAGVDERKHPHLRELLAQGEREQHREVRERGDAAAHVAQHDELWFVRFARLEDRRERYAAARQRSADGAPHVETTGAPVAALGGEPRRQSAGQRVDPAAQLGDLVTRRAQEVDL